MFLQSTMTLIDQKYGNSLAVRLPNTSAKETKPRVEETVEISEDDQSIVLPLPDIPKYSLTELLSKVTPENIHPEVDCGPPIGNEFGSPDSIYF
jgi:antitoxin MazE